MSTSKINVGMISLSIDTLDKVIDTWEIVKDILAKEVCGDLELDIASNTLSQELASVKLLVDYFKELNKDIPIIQKTW